MNIQCEANTGCMGIETAFGSAASFHLEPQLEHIQSPTSDLTAFAMGGIEVNSTVIVPKRLIDRLDSAAALGSVRSNRAVATAEELAPSVTPRVT